jgi:hypothetical protein
MATDYETDWLGEVASTASLKTSGSVLWQVEMKKDAGRGPCRITASNQVIAHFGDIGPTGNARVVGGYALHCRAANCRLT